MNNFTFRSLLSVILFLSTIISGSAVAASFNVDCNQPSTEYIGKSFEYLSVDEALSLEEIKTRDFEAGESEVLNFGISENASWLHSSFSFDNDCLKYLEFDSHGYTGFEVFILSDGKMVNQFSLGDDISFKDWSIPNHTYTVPLDGKTGQTLDLYVKLTSNQQMLVPIRLFSTSEYWKSNLKNNLVFGIYFGIIFVMIFYNIFLYVSVRDVNYLYYVAYILFIGLAQASILGYAQSYLWAENDWLRRNGIILMGALSGIFTILFVTKFLKTKQFTPKLHKVLLGFVALQVVAIILLIAGKGVESFSLINLLAGLGSLMVLVTSLIILRKGFLPAKFFVAAYSLFFLSVIIYVLKDYNIVPYNEFSTKSMIFGSAFEIVLLSLALANRINVLRKEKEISQAQALHASRENERIIREQNVLLEQKVNERTLELQEANEELTVTLSNLRDTQTQLVDAEKMASLGQLTAGIAHEINNPINFVTSNITPLKRDLDDVYELIEAYGAVTESDLEKLKEAHELKEELDYDYLKEEISSLVDGISDGALRTSEIVRGLRTFSRLDEDVIKQADLHEGLASTLVLLRSKFNEGIEIVQDYDNELPQIECFPGKLNQVFMNILNNAIYAVTHKAYTDPEGPRVTIKTQKIDSTVNIHLMDNGIGMDEQTKKKIFDPFFTTKDVGEGTGLGMAIVYKIIQKHGGSLTVESELGKGTEFVITLPLRQPNEFE